MKVESLILTSPTGNATQRNWTTHWWLLAGAKRATTLTAQCPSGLSETAGVQTGVRMATSASTEVEVSVVSTMPSLLSKCNSMSTFICISRKRKWVSLFSSIALHSLAMKKKIKRNKRVKKSFFTKRKRTTNFPSPHFFSLLQQPPLFSFCPLLVVL